MTPITSASMGIATLNPSYLLGIQALATAQDAFALPEHDR
jgi:hypothetical protein